MQAILDQARTNIPLISRAIVCSNDDPDKRGRIRVKYPWLEGNDADMPSEWARVCQPYAASASGSWFLPEVDSEVLVYFENGNIDNPIVLGGLWSEKNAPPDSGRNGDRNNDNKNNLKFIKTRSGHTLVFDDSDDKNSIVLKDKANRRLEIQSKEKKLILSDEKDNSVTIDGPKISIKNENGDKVNIEKGKISIKNSKGDQVDLKGGGISISSSGSIKVESGSVSLGKTATASLLKGEAFLMEFAKHTHLTAWGPSSPPMMPVSPSCLSSTTKTS